MLKLIYSHDGAAQLFLNASFRNACGFSTLSVVHARVIPQYGLSNPCMQNDLNLLLVFSLTIMHSRFQFAFFCWLRLEVFIPL